MEKMQLDSMQYMDMPKNLSWSDDRRAAQRSRNGAFKTKGYDWEGFVVQEWQDHAACSGVDPALFDVDGRKSAEREAKILKALSFCNECPVSGECREAASPEDLAYTVRGGQVPVVESQGFTDP